MENSQQSEDTGTGQMKNKSYDEILVQLGVKKEEFDWNPKVINEPLVRGQSFVCAEYTKPACYRRKPKIVAASAWACDSQATRQLALLPRLGPRRFYYNNQNLHIIEQTYLEGETTQTLGLCCPPKTVTSL